METESIVHKLPNMGAESGFEYGQEARLIFGEEMCHRLALAGEVLTYVSKPQSEWPQ